MSAPIELIVLQGTPFCNLHCTYCDLSVESRRTKTVMPIEIVVTAFEQLFQSDRLSAEITVIWHSGEPLTLPIDYYEEAISRIHDLQRQYGRSDIRISFDIQTNGVLIDERWCDFFVEHRDHLAIGISCDGPDVVHDAFRLYRSGQPTFEKVNRAMDRLRDRQIKYKVIAVVTRQTLQNPSAFYEFFYARRAEMTGFHFNVVASSIGPVPELSYAPEDRTLYQQFYQTLLDLCDSCTDKAGEVLSIANFTDGLGRILNEHKAGMCLPIEQASAPFRSLNIEASGEVTTFYAGLSSDTLAQHYGEGMSLGNLHSSTLEAMFNSSNLERIAKDFAQSTETCRAQCEYFTVCPGGFEITKKTTFDRFDVAETPECIIHVKALTDALLADVETHAEVMHG